MPLRRHIDHLEALYATYHRREHLHPDPLELVHDYESPADREVVGLIAACLAYGRVKQILASSRWVLDRLGDSPAETLARRRPKEIARRMSGFAHRFQKAEHIAALLRGIAGVRRKWGSLGECFRRADDASLPTYRVALAGLREELFRHGRRNGGRGTAADHLLADPAGGSACKRLWLFLRWMIRRDELDVGCWEGFDPARLVVPLDVHMHRVATRLGATRRRSADFRTAEEVTAAFRKVRPDDPVRYDFALTREGIQRNARKVGSPGEERL